MMSQSNINEIEQSFGIFLYTHFRLFGVLFALRASNKILLTVAIYRFRFIYLHQIKTLHRQIQKVGRQ